MLKRKNKNFYNCKLQNMSSIIDNLIFQHSKKNIANTIIADNWFGALQQLSKTFSFNQGAILITSSNNHYQTLSKLKLQSYEYLVRLKADAELNSVKIQMKLLHQDSSKRVSSTRNEIMLLKEVEKWKSQANDGFPFFVMKGSVVMVLKMYCFIFDPTLKKKAAQFYNSMFSKYFKEFQTFVSQKTQKNNQLLKETNETLGQIKSFNVDLFLSHSLSNSNINFEITEEESKYQLIQQELKKKQSLINNLYDQIAQTSAIQTTTNLLFLKVADQILGSWTKANLERKFQTAQQHFKRLLKVGKFIEKKKIDDFIFNTVQVKVNQIQPKPLGEGGSCQIFLAKAQMIFVNSLDYDCYFKNDQKREKLIAIKKLRPQFKIKSKNKLDHERNIVQNLKGGASYFIPKYYKVKQGQDQGNDVLLMEYIVGNELDFFLVCRKETISLQTKLCLLLNIVNGMRHLASHSITHLDLKPINIMVCKNNFLITKIFDFGQSHHPDVCDQTFSPGYSFPYVAPQAFIRYNNIDSHPKEQLMISQKQDIFSFGVIMYEVLFSSKMFQFTQDKYREVYYKKAILERLFLAFQRLEDYGDYEIISSLANLIIRCIDKDPERRPRFDWLSISLRLILNSLSRTC